MAMMMRVLYGLALVMLVSIGTASAHQWVLANLKTGKCENTAKLPPILRSPQAALQVAQKLDPNAYMKKSERVDGVAHMVTVKLDNPVGGLTTLIFLLNDKGVGMTTCKRTMRAMSRMFDAQ